MARSRPGVHRQFQVGWQGSRGSHEMDHRRKVGGPQIHVREGGVFVRLDHQWRCDQGKHADEKATG